LNLLVVTPYYPPHWGGLEVVAYHVASQMAKRGHNVNVVTSAPRCNSSILEENVNVHRVSVSFKVFNTPLSLEAYRVCKILAEHADLIHTYAYPVYFSDISKLIAAKRGIPLVLEWVMDPRESQTYKQSLLARLVTDMYFKIHGDMVFDKASVIIVPSEQFKERVIRYGVSKDKIQVIPCGIDTNIFSPGRLTTKLQKNTKFMILFVGRISEQKGLDILLKALPRVLKEHPDTSLIVIGLCDQMHFWRRIQKDLAMVRGHVRFLENVTRSQLISYYRAAEVLAFPSRYESFGMVPIEAMACGTPVVGTPVGISAGIVRQAGILVNREDPENLAEALNRILSEPHLRQKLSRKSLQAVSDEYCWERIIDKYEDTYQSIKFLR